MYVGGQRTTTVAVCHCTQTAAPAGRVALPALLLSSWPTVAIAIFLLFLRSQSRPRKWPLLRVLPHAQVLPCVCVCVCLHTRHKITDNVCVFVCVKQCLRQWSSGNHQCLLVTLKHSVSIFLSNFNLFLIWQTKRSQLH